MAAKLAAEFLGRFQPVLGGYGSAVLAAAFPGVGIELCAVPLAVGPTVPTADHALRPALGGHAQ